MSGFGYCRASKEIVVFVEGGKDEVSNSQWKRFMYTGYEKSIFTSLHLLSRVKYYILAMLDTSFDWKRFQVEDDSKMDRYWASETIRTREVDIGQTLRKPDREQSFRKRRIKRDRIIVTFVEKYMLINRCNFSMCFIWELFEIERKDGVPFQRGWKFVKVAGCVACCFAELWTFLETRTPQYL